MRVRNLLPILLLISTPVMADRPERLVGSGGLADDFEPPPSIHQIQHEQYRNLPAGPDGPAVRMPPGRSATPVVYRDMFGWIPYWEWDSGAILNEIQWDLMTHVAYFTANVSSTGSITGTHSWSSRGPSLVQVAHANGVKVLLSAVNFSTSELGTLLGSPTYRQNAIDNLVDLVSVTVPADGIAVDFEGLPSSRKAEMVLFLQDLKRALHARIPQADVWVATPAVDWSGAWDFDQVMDSVDGVFIMAYGYHYGGSSQAGPGCPLTSGSIWNQYNLNWTIADYKQYGIARAFRKVTPGFPHYGYSWPTASTSVPSSTTGGGTAIFYESCANEVGTYGRLWDTHSQTPYYIKPGPRQVWYDDEQSMGLKYDLVNSERIGGSGMWALGYDGSRMEIWNKIREKFTRTSIQGLKVGIDPGYGGSATGAVGPHRAPREGRDPGRGSRAEAVPGVDGGGGDDDAELRHRRQRGAAAEHPQSGRGGPGHLDRVRQFGYVPQRGPSHRLR